MKKIDDILNKITMYRVVLYELIGLLVVASIFGLFGWVAYSPINIFFSTMYILAICLGVNKLFAWAYDAPSNPESTYITALILALIITPALAFTDTTFLMFAFWASALAMASKYILAVGKKHIFNPAAIAVVLTAFVLNQSASWWVGTAVMLPFVLFGGFLVTRKIKRSDLVLSAIGVSLAVILGLSLIHGGTFVGLVGLAWTVIISTPLVFFATVMLTEPLTSPPTSILRTSYGALVGVLLSPFVHLGSIFSTPELALVVGNIFSYAVSPKKKLILTLKNVEKVATDTYDFVFTPDQQMAYRPGQYMEWTLAHPYADNRGIRRYFTLASSPTERELRLGVKFYDKGSTFKKKMLAIKRGDMMVASGLAGDFVLPKDAAKKLVFIAGGIGVTPFRSMIQYMIDTGDTRPVTLFYSNKTVADIAYKDVFDRAALNCGVKTVYVVTNSDADISNVPHAARSIDAKTIAEEVPDYKDRTFYLSGPHGMVSSFQTLLQSMGVKESHIKTDFFPGFV